MEARSSAEAEVYLRLRHDDCEPDIEISTYDYALTCHVDGIVRREPLTLTGPEPEPFDYGAGVSRLVDAGQWALLGLRAYEAATGLLTGGEHTDAGTVRRAYDGIGWGRAAFAEVRKFLPAGADELPTSAFWTPAGQVVSVRSPELFTRDGLERILARFDEAERVFVDWLH